LIDVLITVSYFWQLEFIARKILTDVEDFVAEAAA